jgi:hypothetical protein
MQRAYISKRCEVGETLPALGHRESIARNPDETAHLDLSPRTKRGRMTRFGTYSIPSRASRHAVGVTPAFMHHLLQAARTESCA